MLTSTFFIFIFQLYICQKFQHIERHLTSANNSFLLTEVHAVKTYIEQIGDCCKCKSHIEHKVSKVYKMEKSQNKDIIFQKGFYILSVQDQDLVVNKIQQEWELGQLKFQNTEIQRTNLQKTPFENSQIQVYEINENDFILFLENQMRVIRLDVKNKKKIIKVISKSKTKFKTDMIKELQFQSNNLLVLTKDDFIYIYQFDQNLLTFLKKINFKQFSEKKKKKSHTVKVNTIKLQGISKREEFEYCTKEKISEDNLEKKQKKEQSNCQKLQNMKIQIFFIENMHTDDSSIFTTSIKYLLKQKNINKKNVNLDQNNVQKNFQIDKMNFQLLRNDRNNKLVINNIIDSYQISAGRPVSLIYFKKIQHTYFLTFGDGNNIYLFQIYFLSTNPQTKEDFVLQNHTFDLKKDFPFLTTNSPKIAVFPNREKSQNLLISVGGRYVFYQINYDGIQITCNLLGAHYFSMSCREELKVKYLDTYLYDRQEKQENQFRYLDIKVKFKIYKLDKDKLLGFGFVTVLVIMVYFVMANKTRKHYERSYLKLRKNKQLILIIQAGMSQYTFSNYGNEFQRENQLRRKSKELKPQHLKEVIKGILSSKLSLGCSEEYDLNFSKELSDFIKNKIKEYTQDKYKIIVQMYLGQQHNYGMNLVNKCFWDESKDLCITEKFLNDKIFCFVVVYLIYVYQIINFCQKFVQQKNFQINYQVFSLLILRVQN